MRDISMHILDIIGNSVRAKSSLVEVSIIEKVKVDTLVLKIKDDGYGMDDKTVKSALDPFFTSRRTRKVGLGIPLLQQNAQLTGGKLHINSKVGEGTVLEAVFVRYHIDRPPLGDLPQALSLMVSGNPTLDFVYKHVLDEEEFILDTREVKQILEGVAVTEPSVTWFLKQMIEENLMEIGVEL